MKIIFILPAYAPSWTYGGIVTSTVNLCEALVDQGHEVCVLTNNRNGPAEKLAVQTNTEYKINGVSVYYFSTTFGKKHNFYSYDLIKFFRKIASNFDVVDLSMVWQLTGVHIIAISKIIKIPIVFTPHSSLMHEALKNIGNQKIKTVYWSVFGRYMLNNVARIRYLSSGEKSASLVSKNIPSFSIPNGVKPIDETLDRPGFDAHGDRYEKNENGPLRLLYLGRIHSKKNLLAVCKGISESDLLKGKITLSIYGPIEETDYWDKISKYLKPLKSTNEISYCGSLEHSQVRQVMKDYDLFVLPSFLEGVSMANLEALSVGLPSLVAPGVANYDELIDFKCCLPTEPTEASIVSQLYFLLNNRRIMYDLRKNSITCFNELYHISEVAQKMSVAYQDVICPSS